jgi:hypothetical protein
LQHDNALSQGQQFEQIFHQTLKNAIEHPPYSPDMTPADFFLSPKLQLPLRGTRFQSVEDIMDNS